MPVGQKTINIAEKCFHISDRLPKKEELVDEVVHDLNKITNHLNRNNQP